MAFISYVKDANDYTRQSLTVKEAAYNQYVTYLMARGKTLDEAQAILNEVLPTTVPTIVRYNRENCEDKHLQRVTLDEHFQEVKEREYVQAPTFTTYLSKKEKLSFHSDLINKRLDWRTNTKQEMFDAETAQRLQEAEYLGLLQVAIKTGNNSISGIYGIKATAIGNKTAHSTLTSGTRVATNTSNVALERCISGTLLLRHPDSASHYVLSLLAEYNQDHAAIDIALQQLYQPSVEDVYTYLFDNLRRYTASTPHNNRLKDLLSKCTPKQLGFVLYAGCLWNVDKFNHDLMSTIISKMLKQADDDKYERKFAISSIKRSNDNVLNAAHHIRMEELRGRGNNLYNMTDDELSLLTAECYKLHGILGEYSSILYPLLTVSTQPPNMAYTKQMIRWSIVASDTDSNLMTFMNWCLRYNGHKYPTPDNIKLVGVLGVFTGMLTEEVLRSLSTNMGISKEEINKLEMKSEYTPSSIALVGLTKTYYQLILVKEKSILAEPQLIVKGVHLKSSALPPMITKAAKGMMLFNSQQLRSGKPISINNAIKDIVHLERTIISSIYAGDRTFLRLLKINPTENYKDTDPLKNNSGWADFWSDELTVTLPCGFVKLPTIMDNKTRLNTWLDKLPDAKRIHVAKWLEARNRKDLPTFYIPEDYVAAHGVPAWIRDAIDIHRLVSDVCNIFYIILKSLNYSKQKEVMLLEDIGETL